MSPTERLVNIARGTPTAYTDVATNKILTIAEVADRLAMHPVTVYRLAKEGRLPFFRIGRMLRFDAEELEQWVREGRVPMGRRHRSGPVKDTSHNDPQMGEEN